MRKSMLISTFALVLLAATAWGAPTISTVTPPVAHVLGGTAIHITGTGFTKQGTTQVLIGTVQATRVEVMSAAYGNYYIKAFVPAGTVGAKDITVINPDNSSAKAGGKFAYVATPEATSIYPNGGALSGGNTVQVMGRGFSPVGGLSIHFGAANAPEYELNDYGTVLTVTSPSGSTGTVTCSVANSDGSSASGQYEYRPLSLISSSPETGPAMGGTLLEIVGQGITSNPEVLIGGSPATVTNVEGSSRIICRIPPHALGKVDIQVKHTNDDTATLTQAFEYVPGVSIDSLSSGTGPDVGGEIIRIYAQNVEITGTTQVLFGTVPATGVTVAKGGESVEYNACVITCTLPPHAPGLVDVTVTSPSGYSATKTGAFTYAPVPGNDIRETAQCLTSEGAIPCDTSGATSIDAATYSCGNGDFRDLWYSYTPTASGTLTVSINTHHMNEWPGLSVFQGYDGPRLACQDRNSPVALMVQPCTDYLIRVAGYYEQTGQYTLELAFEPDGAEAPCHAVRCSENPHFLAAGTRLVLTAPPGANYKWKKDGVYMEDAPDAITGTQTRYLVFDPLSEEDAGIYTCEYDDGTKDMTQTPPFTLVVNAAGSLPAFGALAAFATMGLLAITAWRLMRRMKALRQD